MARRPSNKKAKSSVSSGKDVDYTMPGLLALVAIVLFTGIFFAQPTDYGRVETSASSNNVGGQPTYALVSPEVSCDESSLCDGTRLIRQRSDCSRYEAFCQNGCAVSLEGATCIS